MASLKKTSKTNKLGGVYDHQKVESKWQKNWLKNNLNKTTENPKKPKHYVLDMFPYPSGDGLHVGHPKGYIATDIYSRFKRMHGFNILHPMGWDAFGLPAENYAIKNKVHPKKAVEKNIKRYKQQLSLIGFNYDWSREINTTDPAYYKWTQWIFLQLYKKGLAYESFEPINWCPSCQTGLANEDVEDGKCERCGTLVEKKPMRQWVLKITKYADRLLKDLDGLDWPKSIKESQKNWIGKSEGVEINFLLNFKKTPEANNNRGPKGEKAAIKVFTTRPETIFGATYLVLAPEHLWVTLATDNNHDVLENKEEVLAYTKQTKTKTEIERGDKGKEKTGVELKGVKAINPATGEEIPLYVADYVLTGYGTGAIMAVPAHDERDFAFAKKFNLPIKCIINPNVHIGVSNEPGGAIKNSLAKKQKILGGEDFYTGNGLLINSGQFNGLNSEKAAKDITKFVGGKITTTYKLRDWVFSRQRYWGEPIPVVHCAKCGVVPIPEKDLPVKLPAVKSYAPTGTGESPLADIASWVNVKCPVCKGSAKRETNTMPQWAGSSWYYLRFMDPKNNKALVDPKKEKYWAPVDMYVGGSEHATRHLIYARFWHKFLADIKVVSTKEPFKRIGKNLGLILGADGRKMSKRWGNVINPDDVIKLYGADTLRVYEMFMGPFDQEIAWNTDSMIGSRRFLERVWRLGQKVDLANPKLTLPKEIEVTLHQTIKKVGEDIDGFNFNTAVSTLMILTNQLDSLTQVPAEAYKILLQLLAPFAPHITDEIWSKLGHRHSIHLEKWPLYNKLKLQEETATITIQVNGKVRGQLTLKKGSAQAEVVNEAKKVESVKKWLNHNDIVKEIYIPDRLVNFVVKP